MFTKLRNRFLIVNLLTISIMMLVAFAGIYIITYRDVQTNIEMDLRKVMESYEKSPGHNEPRMGSGMADRGMGGGMSGGIGDGVEAGLPRDSGPLDRSGEAPMDRSVSFMLLSDKNFELVSYMSKFEMDEGFYEQALAEAAAEHRETGQFSLDGSRWIFSVRPVGNGYMLVFLDVTARKEILTNLIYTFSAVGVGMLIALYFASRFFANRAIAPVKEAFDKQKQFIADASHELKTPLAIINTNADVLLANPEETISRQAKWLHYIKSETERMSKLTRDLLYLTEMDDAKATVLFSRFDLSEAVESVLLTMEAVIFEKELVLNYDIEPGLTAYGNPEQIKQVVMILLDNAAKYTNPQGEIALSLKKQHNEAVLALTNTGEGIPPEHLPRIFDRFYRTDASRARKQGGYGLGLAIAKSIVEQHKGRIYAKSTLGQSTTFYVHLS
ncbi:HAMP domain-containing histidine kinase [Paenibacillus timonensis]|uniref:histidine kinase n=1 Tax=Paenibacillus timonensis TaxID=225915 RepID=A0ABW3SGA1_9BACL|nr:HAMP domain-containing sensor histidine kinase [Paenibacillus timonensis]MCH1641353.1 HAMP domain-containing histidine kinase [Paenibacillus timonensis]